MFKLIATVLLSLCAVMAVVSGLNFAGVFDGTLNNQVAAPPTDSQIAAAPVPATSPQVVTPEITPVTAPAPTPNIAATGCLSNTTGSGKHHRVSCIER